MATRHLTFANVTSFLALFVALSAGSYAAIKLPSNSIGAKQLKSKAVTAPKLANAAVRARSLAANSVNGSKVVDASLTGADIQLGTLGKVPSAATADSAPIAHVRMTTATGTSRDGSISTAVVPVDSATAACDPGLVVIGGGVQVKDTLNQIALDSFPASATTWTGRVVNGGAGTPGFTVYAICASAAGS
jgi:hypothetical protein